jgi:uncharacterized membrane protein YvbJ
MAEGQLIGDLNILENIFRKNNKSILNRVNPVRTHQFCVISITIIIIIIIIIIIYYYFFLNFFFPHLRLGILNDIFASSFPTKTTLIYFFVPNV